MPPIAISSNTTPVTLIQPNSLIASASSDVYSKKMRFTAKKSHDHHHVENALNHHRRVACRGMNPLLTEALPSDDHFGGASHDKQRGEAIMVALKSASSGGRAIGSSSARHLSTLTR